MNSATAQIQSAPDARQRRGPGAAGYLQAQRDFLDDQISFLRGLKARYGDVVFFRLGTFPSVLVTDPELIEEVLVKKHDAFYKDAITHELEDLLGHGLLTSEGDYWRRQRKLAAPALTRKHIANYADWMVELTEDELSSWADGNVLDLHHQLMALTLRVAVRTLFDTEIAGDLTNIGSAIDTAMQVFHYETHTLWRYVPKPLRVPLNKRFDAAVGQLDDVVYRLIKEKRESGAEGDDLLSRFLAARDDDGEAMTDVQLRDEVITMFLAGHETTALAVTYAWYLLSGHPDVCERLYGEVDAVLQGRRATVEDVPRLEYTKSVIQETLRLYSPAWIIGREPTRDIQIGPWEIEAGAQVLMPQSVVHYDARWYPNPEAFWPERWSDGLEKDLPRFAYFPFGGGPRVCIGNHFAMLEATLLLATMAQSVRLENVSAEPLRLQSAVTLRPLSRVSMKVARRG